MFFVVSGLFIAYIFGLGYAAAYPLCLKNDDSSFMEKFPLILTTGFLLNYLIFLLVQSLELSLLFGPIIAVFALIWLLKRRGTEFARIDRVHRFPLVLILSILLLYYFAILSDPLEWWDARSIWFFHSKMMWSAQSINLSAGWLHPSAQFSHVDYPKLVPALAAQVMHILGYWNEYAPKLSLFLILIPPVFWIFSFYSRSLSFLFLVLILPLGLKAYLWNGSMDGYLALYSACAMLLLGRYALHRRQLDLLSGLSCLALASNLKNEGMLIALIGVIVIISTEFMPGKFRSETKKFYTVNHIIWFAVIISPCIVWSVIYKNSWGLVNDLKIGTAVSFYRLVGRLSDGVSFPMILKKTFFHDESGVWLLLITFVISLACLRVYRKYAISWIPALMTAVIYYCGMVTIYLLTPSDLHRHLATSIQRTMLTVTACLAAGTFFILKELEEASKARPQD